MRRLMMLLLAVAIGCGGDTVVSPETITFAGTYALQSINGNRLPYVYVQSGATSATVLEDHLTISVDGTYSETGNVRSVSPGTTTTQTIADAGRWVRSGNSLTMISGNANVTSYTGTFSNNRLDLTYTGLAFVFTK